MSQVFTATELSDMQACQSSYLMDTCILQTHSASNDSYGQPVATYPDATSAITCGFDPTGGRETMLPDKTILKTDAVIRLPIATVLDPKDRIKITKRHGVSITAEIYQVVGNVQRGPSGLIVDVRRVQV
jgi:hypothetical protein